MTRCLSVELKACSFSSVSVSSFIFGLGLLCVKDLQLQWDSVSSDGWRWMLFMRNTVMSCLWPEKQAKDTYTSRALSYTLTQCNSWHIMYTSQVFVSLLFNKNMTNDLFQLANQLTFHWGLLFCAYMIYTSTLLSSLTTSVPSLCSSSITDPGCLVLLLCYCMSVVKGLVIHSISSD